MLRLFEPAYQTASSHLTPSDALQPVRLPPDEASIWIRTDGVIIYASPVFEDWFAYGGKEAQGQPVTNFIALGAANLERCDYLLLARSVVANSHLNPIPAKLQP
jgi:nitrogen-specific signal transduction histidine kinase